MGKKNADIKKQSRRVAYHTVWSDSDGSRATPWKVVTGKLVPGPGRPGRDHLFQVVAEKLPFEALPDVRKDMLEYGHSREGVYLAHDSMGVARYGGRGQVFARLRAHKRKYPNELVYFSFYIIANKQHEREIETIIIRAAGPQLILNDRKRALGIDPGAVGDYEPGTEFYQRRRR